MECSKNANATFWDAFFVTAYCVPKGVPFGIHCIWYFLCFRKLNVLVFEFVFFIYINY